MYIYIYMKCIYVYTYIYIYICIPMFSIYRAYEQGGVSQGGRHRGVLEGGPAAPLLSPA